MISESEWWNQRHAKVNILHKAMCRDNLGFKMSRKKNVIEIRELQYNMIIRFVQEKTCMANDLHGRWLISHQRECELTINEEMIQMEGKGAQSREKDD